jgi:hypothetical protein
MKKSQMLAFCLALAAGVAQAAATATLVRDQDLLVSPSLGASVVTRVSKSTPIEVLQRQAGWVQISARGSVGWVRMLALKTREDAGSTSLTNMLVSWWNNARIGDSSRVTAIAGLRSLPKPQPASHALIMAVGQYGGGIPALSAATQDIDAAVMMANGMGVPEENIVVLKDTDLKLDGMKRALDGLVERVMPGDQVFVYFSGHGTRMTLRDGQQERCAEGLLSADGKVLTDTEIEGLFKRLSTKARRVVSFFDACHSGGAATRAVDMGMTKGGFTAKYWAKPNTPSCETPSNSLSQGLTTRALGASASAGNFIHIASSRADEVSLEENGKGSLATQAWLQCLSEGAKDLDASGGITISEIGSCAQDQINLKVASKSPGGYAPQHITLTGNQALVVGASGGSETFSGGAKAALQDIFANRDARRQVTLTANPTDMRIRADKLGLTLHSTHAGFVYLLMVDNSGKSFDMLFPNKRDSANSIRAGETLSLPRAGWDVMAGGPPGQNTVLAIVSATPRDFSKLGMKPAGPFSAIEASPDGTNNQIQLAAVSTSNADKPACRAVGKQRALVVVEDCSDAYGAAMVTINEVN